MNNQQTVTKKRYYLTHEVAKLFQVNRQTVTRWAKTGRIPKKYIMVTPGGHNRYDADYIDGLYNGNSAS